MRNPSSIQQGRRRPSIYSWVKCYKGPFTHSAAAKLASELTGRTETGNYIHDATIKHHRGTKVDYDVYIKIIK